MMEAGGPPPGPGAGGREAGSILAASASWQSAAPPSSPGAHSPCGSVAKDGRVCRRSP